MPGEKEEEDTMTMTTIKMMMTTTKMVSEAAVKRVAATRANGARARRTTRVRKNTGRFPPVLPPCPPWFPPPRPHLPALRGRPRRPRLRRGAMMPTQLHLAQSSGLLETAAKSTCSFACSAHRLPSRRVGTRQLPSAGPCSPHQAAAFVGRYLLAEYPGGLALSSCYMKVGLPRERHLRRRRDARES